MTPRRWTLDDVSDDEILSLRTVAGEAGDLAQVEICDRALAGDPVALTVCLHVAYLAETVRS